MKGWEYQNIRILSSFAFKISFYNFTTMKIKQSTVYKLIKNHFSNPSSPIDGFQVIEDILVSHDEEDGGGSHELVIKKIKSNKFYQIDYTDWDLNDFEGSDDEVEQLIEVEPKEEVIIKYYPIIK